MIKFSEDESISHGLKFGRATILKEDNIVNLISEIFKLSLDVCRVKISLSNPNAFSLLNSISLPYSIYSILIEQEIDLNKYDPTNEQSPLVFKLFSHSEKEVLEKLVRNILKEDTAQYFEDTMADAIIKRSAIIESIVKFQTSFENKLNADKLAFIAYDNNEPIGFSSLYIENEIAYGDYVGILPNWRTQNLFKDFIKNELNNAKLKSCEKFRCNTVLLNPRSLNATLKVGLKICNSYLNINIFPLLSKNIKDTVTFKVKQDSFSKNILPILTKKFIKQEEKFVLLEIKIKINNNETYSDSWKALSWKLNGNLVCIFWDIKCINYGFAKFSL